MKKLLLILICLLPLSLAAQKFYIISSEQAKEWKQYKITPWWGIDPVQLKNGDWIISETSYKDMKQYFTTEAKDVSLGKELEIGQTDNVILKLDECILRIVLKDEFKEEENIEEVIIKKL